MSTKIYNAYKVNDPKTIWPTMWDIKEKAIDTIKQKLKEHYWELMIRIDLEDPAYKNLLKTYKEDYLARLTMVQNQIKNKYKKSCTTMQRNEYDLDISISIYPYKNNYYIIPYNDGISIIGRTLNFLDNHPSLSDFHYQNQGDKPKNISNKEWEHRKQIWNNIFLMHNKIDKSVELVICSYSIFWQIDPWNNLRLEYKKKPPQFPIKEEILANDLQPLFKQKLKGFPGKIKLGNKILVGKKNNTWYANINEKKEYYENIEKAIAKIHYEYSPPHIKKMIDRYAMRIACE